MPLDENNTQSPSESEISSQEEDIKKKEDDQKSPIEENKTEEVKQENTQQENTQQENNIEKSKVINLTDENFEKDVIKSEKPVLVDFWAEWCGPCKQIAPTLEEISNEMVNDVVIAKHNIDVEPNTPTRYGIRGIPTMLMFKGGELKATKVGATTKSNIVNWIKENL